MSLIVLLSLFFSFSLGKGTAVTAGSTEERERGNDVMARNFLLSSDLFGGERAGCLWALSIFQFDF